MMNQAQEIMERIEPGVKLVPIEGKKERNLLTTKRPKAMKLRKKS